MNCNEVQQHVLDAVDRRLTGDLRAAFLTHLDLCSSCRNEFEFQLLAKQIISKTLRRSATPSHVLASIVSALGEESRAARPERWFRNVIQSRAFAPALTASLALAILMIILNFPRTLSDADFAHTSPNDVINLSVQNFALVRSGDLKPTMIACYPDIVVGYFEQQGVDFAVSVPADDSCDWYGAVSDTYDGVKQAHIVYKRGEDLLYVYEVNKNTALLGSTFTLPVAAKRALAETGWYTDPRHEQCNVVLWTVNETLCAAVSTMNKDRMLGVLAAR